MLKSLAIVFVAILTATAAFAADGARAQPPGDEGSGTAVPLALQRIQSQIVLDGVVNESTWMAVEPLPMTMYAPIFEGRPTEKTEIRIAYDDKYLYVSGVMNDSEPDGVRANSLYRDRYSGDDTFAIVLDTFNDNENALWFFTTPTGVRFDMSVSGDANFSGGRPMNSSWNTYWDVETSTHAEGWSAEMRIPFSSLGFQTVDGDVVMGLITYRYIARKNERHIFPAIPPNWGMGFAKPSVARDVVLTGVTAQRPVYFTPYVLGGIGQLAELSASETGYVNDRSSQREVGADLKYNVTSNLTLDLTVNTDFAQVEADDQQVNLSRFSLFFPEKRQFFQERSGVFDFNTGGPDRLFHSRRIGLGDEEPVRILGGARVVGRVGDWDVGALNMQTGSSGVNDLESENFGVVRLRRNVLNENSSVGGIATARFDGRGDYNVVYGLDAIARVTGEEYLTVQFAQVFDDTAGGSTLLESSLMRVSWQRRTSVGPFYSAVLSGIGKDFEPGIGFIRRQDNWQSRARVGYGWFAGEDSRIRQVTPEIGGFVVFRREDGSVESAELGAELEVELKSGGEFQLETQMEVEDLEDVLEFDNGSFVPAGRYTSGGAELSYRHSSGSLVRGRASASAGSFFDGRLIELSFSPSWAVSKHLEVGVDFAANFVSFPKRDQTFNFVVTGGRIQFALNRQVSATIFTQYNSAADFTSTNFRFRYNFQEGRDLWLVFDEGNNWNRLRETPTLPITDRRTLVLKYTHTLSR